MEGAPRGPECGAALLARSRRSRSGSAGPVRCWEQQNHRAGQGWCRSGARSSRTIGQGRAGAGPVPGTAEPSGRAGPVWCREQQNHRAGLVPVRCREQQNHRAGQGWCRSGPVPGAAEPSGRAGLVPVRCPEQQNRSGRAGARSSRTIGQGRAGAGPVPGAAEPSGRAGLGRGGLAKGGADLCEHPGLPALLSLR
ncbi:uncharacterized protein LOC130249990 isoform X9 [Oenanthe melanoleuca]|uniref:uncharacterized protein LOC130249990 isoform X9 n=1 Tax=Oenanthe melanoleuca TaxID=2939378 RepID=UPI0024C1A65D|nr:uncharacterized protein LOC130249990 isoform X9 [Oenanthe melanoleuca]